MTQTTLDQIMICGGFDEYILATSPAKLMSGPCSHYKMVFDIDQCEGMVPSGNIFDCHQNHKMFSELSTTHQKISAVD